MRIAHISDLHLLSLAGAIPLRLFNKRITGYANLRLDRRHTHRPQLVYEIAEHLRNERVDHVCITGDFSNLALEVELQLGRRLLDDVLAMPKEKVSLVPGNHDVYTRGSERSRRFFHAFEPYLQSDLPELATTHAAGPFPFVKLRGPVAIIGLATAIPRSPFLAAGKVGKEQLDALASVLSHPEVKKRTPVLMQHHPLHNPPSKLKATFRGLDDADALIEHLSHLPRGLLLHGHLHRRIRRSLPTRGGEVIAVGATSASLVHESPERMAGYNIYDIEDDGTILRIESHALDRARGEFVEVSVPETVWR